MFNHMIFQLLNWVESIRKGRVTQVTKYVLFYFIEKRETDTYVNKQLFY